MKYTIHIIVMLFLMELYASELQEGFPKIIHIKGCQICEYKYDYKSIFCKAYNFKCPDIKDCTKNKIKTLIGSIRVPIKEINFAKEFIKKFNVNKGSLSLKEDEIKVFDKIIEYAFNIRKIGNQKSYGAITEKQIQYFKNISTIINNKSKFENLSEKDINDIDNALKDYKLNKSFYNKYVKPVKDSDINKYLEANKRNKSIMLKNGYLVRAVQVAAAAAVATDFAKEAVEAVQDIERQVEGSPEEVKIITPNEKDFDLNPIKR